MVNFASRRAKGAENVVAPIAPLQVKHRLTCNGAIGISSIFALLGIHNLQLIKNSNGKQT
jgi:hypothetical protein